MADKVAESLVDALRQCAAEGGEQRLFRSGKLAGLFASRGGANAEAAARAVREGLLEVVRTEVKGKTAVEWVRLTPKGVDFLHEHDSPVRVLEELREILRINQEGAPVWLGKMQQDLWALGNQVTEDVQRLTRHLESLSQRVEEALRRADLGKAQGPNGVPATVPWALEALAYLDRRQSAGGKDQCPLPELFAALRQKHADLSITAFHDGLRRLYDRRAVRLLSFKGQPDELPEPEFALLDGAAVLYYVAR
jgi:hypothetical protein